MDPLVISALVAGVSAVAGLFGVLQARKKIDVEVDSVIVTSAEKSVQLGLRQLEYLEKEVDRLRKLLQEEREKNQQYGELVDEVRSLKREILALKIELAARPTKEDLRIEIATGLAEIKTLTEQLRGLGQTPDT